MVRAMSLTTKGFGSDSNSSATKNQGNTTHFIRAAYFAAVPLSLGSVMGWFGGLDDSLLRTITLPIYWILFLSYFWITSFIFCYLVDRYLTVIKLPLWLLLCGAPFVGNLFLLEPIAVGNDLGRRWFGDDGVAMEPIRYELSWNFVWLYFYSAIPGTLVWVAVNMYYHRILGVIWFPNAAKVSGIGSISSNSSAGSALAPALLEQSKFDSIEAIHYIQAQEHYIKIYGADQHELIRYSFGRAVEELAGAGHPFVKIHRSFLVSVSAIERLEKDGHRYSVILKGGKELPVSRTYLQQVRDNTGLVV